MPEEARDITKPFTDAVREAEGIIASAPHVQSQQNLLEGTKPHF